MATTANGTPYVESSDLVANYPAVSLALAEHIDDLGKILQVVRATDATDRTTTSTAFVDASISVTITPQRDTSAILLIWSFNAGPIVSSNALQLNSITDSSNNPISGAQGSLIGNAASSTNFSATVLIGYATPATTSAVTYKGRFAKTATTSSANIENARSTGQLYAIEVSA